MIKPVILARLNVIYLNRLYILMPCFLTFYFSDAITAVTDCCHISKATVISDIPHVNQI